MWDILNIKGLTPMEQALLIFVIILAVYIAFLVKNLIKMTKKFQEVQSGYSQVVHEQNIRIQNLENCCDSIRNKI